MAERTGRKRQGSKSTRRRREVDRVEAAEDMLSELDNLMTEMTDRDGPTDRKRTDRKRGASKSKRGSRKKKTARDMDDDGMLLDLDIEVEPVQPSLELMKAMDVKREADNMLKVSGSNQVLEEMSKGQKRMLYSILCDVTPKKPHGGVKDNEQFIRNVEKKLL